MTPATTYRTGAGVRTSIRHLQGRHAGETICVIAPGASMDFISPTLLSDSITIAVDRTFARFPSTYVVTHDPAICQEAVGKGLTLVCPEFIGGQQSAGRSEFEGDYYYFSHSENPGFRSIDLSALDTDDHLAISGCPIATAVHLAAHMGACPIVLCGADFGRIDGLLDYAGYEPATDPSTPPMAEPLLIRLVTELRTRGRLIVSASPFIGLGLEGHKYSRPPAGTVYTSIDASAPNSPKVMGKGGV